MRVGDHRTAATALTVLVPVVLFLAAPDHALAQGANGVEVFFGVNYVGLGLDGLADYTGESTLNMVGVHGDITFYLNDSLGLVLEGSFPREDLEVTVPSIEGGTTATVEFNQATYLAGPRYRFNAGGTVTPSFQGLIGFTDGSVSTVTVEGVEVPVLVNLNDSSFAAAFAATLDLRIGSTLAVRLLQAGVLFTGYGDQSQTSLRLSAGIVGRF